VRFQQRRCDAARLAQALTDGTPVLEALTSYQHDLTPHGQAAVTESLQNAERLFSATI
jgi:hypothetical protein